MFDLSALFASSRARVQGICCCTYRRAEPRVERLVGIEAMRQQRSLGCAHNVREEHLSADTWQ